MYGLATEASQFLPGKEETPPVANAPHRSSAHTACGNAISPNGLLINPITSTIPPNAPLKFDIELLEIEKPEE